MDGRRDAASSLATSLTSDPPKDRFAVANFDPSAAYFLILNSSFLLLCFQALQDLSDFFLVLRLFFGRDPISQDHDLVFDRNERTINVKIDLNHGAIERATTIPDPKIVHRKTLTTNRNPGSMAP
jgi:hypothetical protein